MKVKTLSGIGLLLAGAAFAVQLEHPALRKGTETAGHPILGGKGTAKIFFDAQAGSTKAALDELQLEAGAVVPKHQHDGSDELLYVVSGAVDMTLYAADPVSLHAEAGDAIRIPAGTPHEAKASVSTRLVQVYAPPGPEQRFLAH